MKLFDASGLICLLKEIDEPQILDNCTELGHPIYTTQEVYSELQSEKETFQKLQQYGKITVLPEDNKDCIVNLKRRYPWIHDGEASVICMGQYLKENNRSSYNIIDERAREISKHRDIPTTGIIGLILWQSEKNKLTEQDLLRLQTKLRNSRFRVSESLLTKLHK